MLEFDAIGDGSRRVCLYAFILVLYTVCAYTHVCPWWLLCGCVCMHNMHVYVCVCVYDRVNPAACEPELFIV